MSAEDFKNKIRVRVNGILRKQNKVLLVQLCSPVTDELIWMPPGGAVQFGESMREALKREFLEETGFKIMIGRFRFVNEMIKVPFHAVELYFDVEKMGGRLQLGKDPELADKQQLLKDVQWIPLAQLDEMEIAPGQLIEIMEELPNV